MGADRRRSTIYTCQEMADKHAHWIVSVQVYRQMQHTLPHLITPLFFLPLSLSSLHSLDSSCQHTIPDTILGYSHSTFLHFSLFFFQNCPSCIDFGLKSCPFQHHTLLNRQHQLTLDLTQLLDSDELFLLPQRVLLCILGKKRVNFCNKSKPGKICSKWEDSPFLSQPTVISFSGSAPFFLIFHSPLPPAYTISPRQSAIILSLDCSNVNVN